MSTTLKVLSAKKVVATHQVNQGEMLIIEAQDKSNYQLIDDKTGLGPQNIVTKREGKDLKIFLNDGDMNEDIIIKNYYDDEAGETTNLIVGQHENSNIYAYVPESGVQSDAVSLLADQSIAPQALGGEELAGAFWAFNPWWLLGLAALTGGIAAAASGGSSGGSSKHNQELADAKDAAKKEIDEAASAKKEAIDKDENASQSDKDAAKAKVDEEATKAKDAI
ncbi:DUF1542 domain-containing protein, partial [Rodentibacter rarus]|uniref:DUF1542 domain-containing protein n=1 Tax=Rodentibacter rarus TaxID=1908260 RepID=UPI00117A7119